MKCCFMELMQIYLFKRSSETLQNLNKMILENLNKFPALCLQPVILKVSQLIEKNMNCHIN